MSLVQSVISQVVGTLLQILLMVAGSDRRSLILERRGKVLALAKEMRAAGLSATKLRALEKSLTSED